MLGANSSDFPSDPEGLDRAVRVRSWHIAASPNAGFHGRSRRRSGHARHIAKATFLNRFEHAGDSDIGIYGISANGFGLVGPSPPNHLKTTELRPTERNYTELVRWKKTLQQRHFRAGAAGADCGKLGNGGRGWIRTTVGVSQRVYSASPLAARAPVRRARYIG